MKACSEAKVSLSWIPLNVDLRTFELILGTNNNRGLAIKNSPDGSDGITAAEDLELLACNHMNSFYVTWSEQFIKVIFYVSPLFDLCFLDPTNPVVVFSFLSATLLFPVFILELTAGTPHKELGRSRW